jgi:hypothetical protein
MRILLIAIVSLCFTQVQAQEIKENSCRIKFQSDLQMGVLVGEGGHNFQIQSVNGIRIKSFSIGLGAGIDFYAERSIPVFLDIKKDLFGKRETPFIYFSGGRHFPWKVENEEEWNKSEQEPGWFYDAGIGYTIPLKKQSIIFSAGYSYKSYDETVKYNTQCLWGDCPTYNEDFSYQLRRISLRAGIRF